MANRYWTGAVSGDINNDSNWDSVRPDAGGTDVAICSQGSQDMDTNTTSPTNAQWGGLVITPGYKGAVGASGNELTVGLTKIKHSGGGALWVKDGGTTTDVYIAAANANTVVNLGADTMANVTLLRGDVTLAGDMGVIARLIVGLAGRIGEVTATLTGGMSAVTKALVRSGLVTVSSTISLLEMQGGRLVVPVGSAGTLSKIEQSDGHILVNSTNTLPDILSLGGIIDLGNTGKIVTKSVHVGNMLFNPTIHDLQDNDDIEYLLGNQ